jgi:hypothetical protein
VAPSQSWFFPICFLCEFVLGFICNRNADIIKNLPTFSRNFLKTLLCMLLVLPCENSHIITIFVRIIFGGVIAFFDLDYCTQNSLIVVHSTFYNGVPLNCACLCIAILIYAYCFSRYFLFLLGTYRQDKNMSTPPEGRSLFMHQWSQNKHSSPCYFELWLGLVDIRILF